MGHLLQQLISKNKLCKKSSIVGGLRYHDRKHEMYAILTDLVKFVQLYDNTIFFLGGKDNL